MILLPAWPAVDYSPKVELRLAGLAAKHGGRTLLRPSLALRAKTQRFGLRLSFENASVEGSDSRLEADAYTFGVFTDALGGEVGLDYSRSPNARYRREDAGATYRAVSTWGAGFAKGPHRLYAAYVDASRRNAWVLGASHRLDLYDRAGWRIDGTVSGFLDFPMGTFDAKTRATLGLGATVRRSIGPAVEASLGAELYPWGLPHSGTKLSGLTGYLLYEPGGAAGRLRTRTVGWLEAALTFRF
jgi:hypothetical protein